MKMKKLAASALALATAAAICAPAAAFADGLDDSTVIPATPNVTSAGGATDSTITGTIKATTLSVSVPTKAAFNVDPGAAAKAGEGGQYASPTNYTVTNKSVVPVYAYVSKVAVTGVSLVDASANVKPATNAGDSDAAIMFAVKEAAAAPTGFDTAGDWLTTTTSKYYAFNVANNGKLDAAGGTAAAATMKFYGQAPSTNWSEAQTFTVTPTFTISTTAPTA